MLSQRKILALTGATLAAGAVTAASRLRVPPLTQQTSHRPWPMPPTRWVMFMRWHDLLFLHWPVRPETIRPLIAPEVELETFDGWCWIGVVPFHMSAVRLRYVPVPFAFPELNVRTYVRTSGRSGVWFFSLDAASRLAVAAARGLGLPYYRARMAVRVEQDTVRYRSVRTHTNSAPAEFSAAYRPTGAAYHAIPGTLDHWLTEKYRLYGAKTPHRVVCGDIHHPPWLLQPAEVELRRNTMTRPLGIELPATEPICHFARLQAVVAWPVVPIERASASL